jgi:hypothetical protein
MRDPRNIRRQPRRHQRRLSRHLQLLVDLGEGQSDVDEAQRDGLRSRQKGSAITSRKAPLNVKSSSLPTQRLDWHRHPPNVLIPVQKYHGRGAAGGFQSPVRIHGARNTAARRTPDPWGHPAYWASFRLRLAELQLRVCPCPRGRGETVTVALVGRAHRVLLPGDGNCGKFTSAAAGIGVVSRQLAGQGSAPLERG